MTIPKIFINSDLMAVIPCEKCGKSYQKDVSKFIDHETQVKLKYKCKCQNTFSVLLERRQCIRKGVKLTGSLIVKQEKFTITVVDISKYGVKLETGKKLPLDVNDIIQINFTLDDSNRSKVSKDVRVKRLIAPTSVGCEFLAKEHFDNLGKYFLFYF